MSVSLVAAAFVAFVATTVDDLIIVTALFTRSHAAGKPGPAVIVGGQYAGFVAIVGISLAGAAGLRTVPDRWVGLLGFIPIWFGLRGLWRLRHQDGESSRPPLAETLPRIAALTFAGGADNIGVFTPLLRSMPVTAAWLTSAGFTALVAVWCALGALLGTHRAVVVTLGRIDHWLVPLVFIVIGVLVLVSTGTLGVISGG